MTLRGMLDRAIDLAESDPDLFVEEAGKTRRAVAQVLAEGGKKIDAAYQQVRTPERARRTLRNAAIKTVARELKRRRGL